MKRPVLYFVIALALVLCVALPVATPVVADGIGGYKVTVWDSADGHPHDVYLIDQIVYYSLQIRNNSPTDDMILTITDSVPLEPESYAEIPGLTATYWWDDITHAWNLTGPGTKVTIPPAGSWNGTFNHMIQKDDLRVQPIYGYNVTVNRVFAKGTQGLELVDVGYAAEVRVIQPAIELEKTVTPSVAVPGQNVTYTFNVTNTGDWPLEDITLDDDILGDLTGDLPLHTLNAAGEADDSCSFSYNYTIKAGDPDPLHNTATVNGTAQGFDASILGAVVEASASADVDIESQVSIQVEKRVKDSEGTWQDANDESGPFIPSSQDPVIFKFTVQNNGNVVLNSVNLTDTHMTSFYDDEACTDPPVSFPTTLAVNQTRTYYGQLDWGPGQHTNTATAEGTPPAGDDVDSTDDANYFGSDPHIVVNKYVKDNEGTWQDANSPPYPSIPSSQDPVVFKFTVENDGNVVLNSVNLTDTHIADFYDNEGCTGSPVAFPTTLAVNQTRTYYGQLDWAAGNHSNTAVAEGRPPVGDDVDSTDEANYLGSAASIKVQKYVKDSLGAWWDANGPTGPFIPSSQNPVVFKFTVRNSGNVTLTGVNLTDSDMTNFYNNEACTDPPVSFPITLAVNETATYYGQLPWAPGQHTNTATVEGTPPEGDDVEDSDDANYFGSSPVVGWDIYPVDKVRVLIPWIAFLGAFIGVAGLLVLRRRRLI